MAQLTARELQWKELERAQRLEKRFDKMLMVVFLPTLLMTYLYGELSALSRTLAYRRYEKKYGRG